MIRFRLEQSLQTQSTGSVLPPDKNTHVIFELTGMDKIFPMTHTQAEAITKVQMYQKS